MKRCWLLLALLVLAGCGEAAPPPIEAGAKGATTTGGEVSKPNEKGMLTAPE